MKNHSLRTFLIAGPLTILLGRVLTIATLSLALSGIVAAADEVPFQGRLEGAFTTTPIDPTFFGVLLNARGNGSQLGQFTLVMPHIVNSTTGTAIGSIKFKTNNGDTLTADFTGVGSPTATPGVFSIVDTAFISGGTGRFAGATGSFKFESLVDFTKRSTTSSFDGTISSPGAKHAR